MIVSPRLQRLLPFLRWLPYGGPALRADFLAGLTVALVLVPQSMAYAQLAGLPPHYGLYTAFLPVIVGALWGSSAQLASGPVAVVSLMTAAALTPLAVPGSEHYVALAILLAFLVGVIQLLLGGFRLGFVVNFLSLPVIAGFTSAAAIIIALSQLDKLFGLATARSGSFLRDVWLMLGQLPDAHWPTLAFGVCSFAAMVAFRRFLPRWPGVLIVVAVATTKSRAIGFERTERAGLAQLDDAETAAIVGEILEARGRIGSLAESRTATLAALKSANAGGAGNGWQVAALRYHGELIDVETELLKSASQARLGALQKFAFQRTTNEQGETVYRPYRDRESAPLRWRIRSIDDKDIRFSGGGDVVGSIPAGLPGLALPGFDLGALISLVAAAFTISLVGFMEAISIAKVIAVRTRQRIDANQELIGQGLANLAGSFTQCYPASGSFSRTAVNAQAGARTGLSSVVTTLVVMLTLLLLTPLLYHMPQAVLAAVIMLAVTSLMHFDGIVHAWRVNRHDGMAGAATFVVAIALAPHLDIGILFGAGLSVLLFLYRSMRPRVSILGRHRDGSLRDAATHDLPLSEHVVAMSFDGQLYFANVPYFQDSVDDLTRRFPRARYILIVGDGINQIDASGEQTIRHLAEHLRDSGVQIGFSGLKPPVRKVLEATGLAGQIGANNFFTDANEALEAIADRIDAEGFDRSRFVLLRGVADARSRDT